VRELENILERALTLCEGNTIEAADLRLPSHEKGEPARVSSHALDSYLDDVERQKILAALEKTRWNKTAAAKMLGISFRALRYRLEKLGMD
jgi:two-component system, NtrC family, response regulator PilR